MRLLTAVLVLAVFTAAASAQDAIEVPGTHTYVDSIEVTGAPPETVFMTTDVGVATIQEGIDLAYMLTHTHDLAYLTKAEYGHVNVVEIKAGVYDSVRMYGTPLGVRSAIARLKDSVVVRGVDRDGVILRYAEADYGLLAIDVSSSTAIENLTLQGTEARSYAGGEDDRILNAGIGCLENASPAIRDVSIVEGGTGITVLEDCAPVIEGVLVARGGHHGIYVRFTGADPVVIDRTTLVGNFDYGIYVSSGKATVTNTCVTHSGKVGIYSYLSDVDASYVNAYWNDRASADPTDINENVATGAGIISEEPYYCDFTGAQGYDYHVCVASSNIGSGAGGVDIGAFGAACADCVSPVEATSWTSIKALFR